MSLWVLQVVLRLAAIRGQLPHHGDFGAGRSYPSHPASGRLLRILACCIAALVLLSLILWTVVWLTIRLL
jgi:hypothetical protein